MKKRVVVIKCKKCGSEASLQQNDCNTLIRVKCSNCDNAGPYECFQDAAILEWEKQNK